MKLLDNKIFGIQEKNDLFHSYLFGNLRLKIAYFHINQDSLNFDWYIYFEYLFSNFK